VGYVSRERHQRANRWPRMPGARPRDSATITRREPARAARHAATPVPRSRLGRQRKSSATSPWPPRTISNVSAACGPTSWPSNDARIIAIRSGDSTNDQVFPKGTRATWLRAITSRCCEPLMAKHAVQQPDSTDDADIDSVEYYRGPGRRKKRSSGPVDAAYADGGIENNCDNCGASALQWCRHKDGTPRKVPCPSRGKTTKDHGSRDANR
jgi:hypothetical protein